MREARGDLWDFHALGRWICITTNGFIKNNGELVMGRGCALEAKRKWPGLAFMLGKAIKEHGNVVLGSKSRRMFTFPVKHHWYEAADPILIEKSARRLMELLDEHSIPEVYLPRPGCGNGQLRWEDVKPILEPILDDRVVVITF